MSVGNFASETEKLPIPAPNKHHLMRSSAFRRLNIDDFATRNHLERPPLLCESELPNLLRETEKLPIPASNEHHLTQSSAFRRLNIDDFALQAVEMAKQNAWAFRSCL